MTNTSDNPSNPTVKDLSYLRQVLNEYLVARDWSLPCTRGNNAGVTSTVVLPSVEDHTRGNPHTFRYIKLKAGNDNQKR
jgi:hypothetical protein